MDYQNLVRVLAKQKLTLTCAESLTGGSFQSSLCKVSNAGDIFLGGFVTYATEAKIKMLSIDSKLISKYGVVSQSTAKEMAAKSREILQADIGISFTGVAGPDKLENQPVGTVYIGVSTSASIFANHYRFEGTSTDIVEQSCNEGLNLLAATCLKS